MSTGRGRAILKEFIEKYRSLKCLWDTSDKDYKSKRERLNAIKQLLQILKKTDEDANVYTVTKKINTLRSCFKKEHNKVKASYQSGAGKYDVHIPKLWYYKSLLFLIDNDNEPRELADVDPIHIEVDCQSYDTDTKMEPSSPISQSSVITNASQTQSGVPNKQHEKIKNVFGISKTIDSVLNSKPTFTSFGEHVAERLRSMSQESARYCQKIINDAIFEAEFDNLNHSSRIVTDYLQRPSQTDEALDRSSPLHSS